MNKLKKYLLLVFLMENVAVQTTLFSGLTDIVFYGFLFIGLVLMLTGNIISYRVRHKFGWMFVLLFIYIIYEFFVGFEYISQKTILYTVAKVCTFSIIMTSIDEDEEFYRTNGVKILVFVIAGFLLYGLLSGTGMSSEEDRIRVGMTNSNTTGSMGAIIVGVVVFLTKKEKWSVPYYFLLLIGLVGILLSGSRAGLLMVSILVFFRYGVNIKTIGMFLLLLITAEIVLPFLGHSSILFDRVFGTLEGSVSLDRDDQRDAAIWMIQQKPWSGWGYMAENQGYAAAISQYKAHNGYLQTFVYMGLPMGFLWFLIVGFTILKYIRFMRKKRVGMDLFLALVLMLLVKSMYESLFVGVHEFETNLFFVALAIMTARMYSYKNGVLTKK